MRLKATLSFLFFSAWAAPAVACPVCYGGAEGPIVRGAQLSVFALLGVTYFVIGSLLIGFVVMRRRARALASPSNAGGR